MKRRPAPLPLLAGALLAGTILTGTILAGCATQTPPTPPQGSTPAIAPDVEGGATTVPVPPTSDDTDLATMRADFVRDTAARFGIPAAEIAAVLDGAVMQDSIIAAMSRPAERTRAWHEYRPIFLTDARIRDGRAFLAAHRDALARVEAQTGVPAEIIVAITGVETSFGRITGNHRVVDALYTLAFAYPRTGDPAQADREDRRELFFRDELAHLFALAREQDLDLDTLKGSYAGAMGWGQFMPSSYRKHAVDGDGNGRVDLFGSLDDVFASIANYFLERGDWQRDAPVMVRALKAPGAVEYNAPDTDDPLLAQSELAGLGYRPATPVPPGANANVIRLDGAGGPEYWMIFHNFKAITEYNNSRMYASAVYQLAREIAGEPVE